MFLIDKFQQFYGEVLRLQAKLSEGSWVFDGTGAADATELAAETSPSVIWRRLLAILERQSVDAAREGGDFAVELYRRAQYAMAALADEIFLSTDWAGREAWRQHLLESRLFGSHTAGETLFDRIEEVLRDRESVHLELGRVYLLVLALGFQGKFRGRPEAEQDLAAYRRRLYRFVFGRDPQVLRGNESLVPQAYASTLNEARPTELPYLRRWVWLTVLIVVLWLGGSAIVWRNAVTDLEKIVHDINDGGANAVDAGGAL
jgi:type VI secretion system protein ImpK